MQWTEVDRGEEEGADDGRGGKLICVIVWPGVTLLMYE